MKLKAIFQEFLIKYGGTWALKYVKKNRLKDEVVNQLIYNKKDTFLLHYIHFHILSQSQIALILDREEVDELMIEAVKMYRLNPEQQANLVNKNNIILTESYLCPKGFFDTERRFALLPEYLFINSIINSEKLIGTEVLKTYVDNCCRTLLTEDLIKLLIANETSFVTKYIFIKCRLRKEWEKMFIETASESLIKYYIDKHEFIQEASQLLLVSKYFSLAQLYYEKYKLRSQAQQLYHELRKKRIEQKKAES